PRPAAGFSMARHRVCDPAVGRRVRAANPRENRARPGESTLSENCARSGIPLRGSEVKKRIFFRLLGAFALVIAAVDLTVGFSAWLAPASESNGDVLRFEPSLLLASAVGLVVAAILAGLAAHSAAGRLQKIVHFAERIAAGELTARVGED